MFFPNFQFHRHASHHMLKSGNVLTPIVAGWSLFNQQRRVLEVLLILV